MKSIVSMKRWTVFVVLLSFLFWDVGSTRRRASDPLEEIRLTIHEMFEMMRQENRLNEIKNIVQMEKTLEDIRRKVDDIHARTGDGRGGGGLDRNFLDHFERLNSRVLVLESSAGTFQNEIREQMAAGSKKIADVHDMTKKWEQDLDVKLRKMMNTITSVYEINKNLERTIDGGLERSSGPLLPSSSSTDSLRYISDQVEGMEQRIKEEINVLTVHAKRKFSDLESTTKNLLTSWASLISDLESLKSQCGSQGQGKTVVTDKAKKSDDPFDEDYEYQFSDTSGGDRQRTIVRPLQRAIRNLTNIQNQIKGELSHGFKRIEDKISKMATPSGSQQSCGPSQEIRTSELETIPVISLEYDRKPGSKTQHQGGTKDSKGRTGGNNDSRASDPIQTKGCTNVTSAINPKSCAEIQRGGATCNGVYIIFPMHKMAQRVFCDMTSEGGGWTVILRRGHFGEPRLPFAKTWSYYKSGFGFPEQEHWIGNEALYHLTLQDNVMLRVNLETFDGEHANITYNYFAVSNESDRYRLMIGGMPERSRHPGSDFLSFNDRPFGTYDRPNQSENCPEKMKGGWWFRERHCQGPFLTGPYFKKGEARNRKEGIQWPGWRGDNVLSYAEMKIRPQNF